MKRNKTKKGHDIDVISYQIAKKIQSFIKMMDDLDDDFDMAEMQIGDMGVNGSHYQVQLRIDRRDSKKIKSDLVHTVKDF